jgi:hypothetical protein
MNYRRVKTSAARWHDDATGDAPSSTHAGPGRVPDANDRPHRQIRLSSGRHGALARVAAPLLRHYFVLTFPHGEPLESEETELFHQALHAGRALSLIHAGKPDAFLLIHSGHATRRAMGWHLHVLVLQHRWEKAWVYLMLGGKNILQAIGMRHDRH